MDQKQISLILWKEQKVIAIVGIDFLHLDYLKRLVIEKIIEHTPPIAKHKYTNNNAIYNFCQRILDYAKKSCVQVTLDNNIQKVISNLRDQEKRRANNVKIAKIIKFLQNVDFQNIFNLNLLKDKTKQKIPSDYDYYFKLFDNIDSSIKKNMISDCVPYPLQTKSIYHHIILGSACNFSVPGAGKTLISLIIFLFLKSENEVNKLLLVSPLSSHISWKDEYQKFIQNASAKEDVLDIGNLSYKEDRLYSLSNPDKPICLINYEKIDQNKNLLIEFLKENDVFLVFDEAHKIKNFDSKRTQAAKEISKYCKNKLILTGTPMPKGYEDLKTYFEVINQLSIKNTKILDKSEDELKQMTKEPLLHSKQIDGVQKQIDNFYTRISKKDLNLGEQKLFVWSDFKNDEKHQKIYDIIEQKLIDKLKISRDKKKLTDILKARIFRLMQTSIDPRMVLEKFGNNLLFSEMDWEYNDNYSESTPEEQRIEKYSHNPEIQKETSALTYELRPTRYNFCFQKVHTLFKLKKIKKIIIWSCWIYVIEELFKVFSEQGYVTEKIYGITEFNDRTKHFHDFQDDNGKIQVLICNPVSVSESISLHQNCHDAVYFDMTWNALYYMQSRERIHRYNKDKNPKVNYYILIDKNSIDSKIWKNIDEKEKKMLEIIENKKLISSNDSFSHLIWDDVLNDYWKEIKSQQK